MSNEEAKEVLKSVYNEDPTQFKQTFTDIIKTKILDKINDEKATLLSSLNGGEEVPAPAEETEETSETEETETEETPEETETETETEETPEEEQ